MRRGAFIIIAACCSSLLGCECSHKPATTAPSATTKPIVQPETAYEPSHASALAFSPPIAQNDPPINLSRADREPGAFVGYDDLIRTFIYVRTDDRWTGDANSGSYERRAIIEKVGSSTR